MTRLCGASFRPEPIRPFGWHLRSAIVVAFFAILLFIMATTQPAERGRFAVDIFLFFFTAKMSRITRILVRPWVFNLSECRCWKRQCFYDELCHFQNMGISQRAYFIVCSCAVMIMKPCLPSASSKGLAFLRWTYFYCGIHMKWSERCPFKRNK